MNVSAWLRGMGLERYAAAFRDNDVDAAVLPRLTAEDLLALGIHSVGHRRRLLNAIAALARESTQARTDEQTTLAGAERRQLTVLYCALAGAAGLSSRLDSEELREVVRRFHAACMRLVAEYEGYVANFFGDCVLAYFGWPQAHEDDAQRAVRAGLALVPEIGGLRTPSGEALAARVGIATGEVVVGDLIVEGPAHEQSAVGVTPNLAARLQALAEPEQIVVDGLTQRLLGAGFETKGLGEHELKGILLPVPAYAVVAERSLDSRFEASSAMQVAPMVGREGELALLSERWDQAQGGEGQVVLLVGEAGIGKSRLVRALLDACAGRSHYRVRWQCSPYHSGSALWPVIQRLSHAAGLRSHDAPDAALDKVEALLSADNDTRAVYATLLGLNGTQRYGPMTLTPQMLRERTLELLVEQLFDLSQERPVLLVIEDAHWIDPTTLELIELCLQRTDGSRMLLIITSRPDRQPSLAGYSHTLLALNRLSRASAKTVVAHLGGQSLNSDTLDAIVARTDGVPLFAEELTKAVMETGEKAIPASLQGSLMARLDRVPNVKEVAQAAACIGREFDHALLRAALDDVPSLDAGIEQLVAAELIFRVATRPVQRYVFKHALVQEVAYESMLRSRRQLTHDRIFQALQARGDAAPEILAHHAQHAGERADEAVAYWREAGEAAQRNSAYAEAAAHLARAIEVLQALPDSADRRRQEVRTRVQLGQAYSAWKGFGAEATRQAFDRAYSLLDSSHDPLLRYHATFGVWVWTINRSEFRRSLLLARELVATLQTQGDDTAVMLGLRLLGVSNLCVGNASAARENFEHALSRYNPRTHQDLTPEIGFDLGALLHAYHGWTLCTLGYAEQGQRALEEAERVGSQVGTANARAHALFLCALAATCVRDVGMAERTAAALAQLARTYHLAMYGGYAAIFLASVASERGRHQEAIEGYERGFHEVASAGSRINVPYYQAGFAVSLAASGQHDRALRVVEAAMSELAQTGPAWWEPELSRVRGELCLKAGGNDAQAMQSLDSALDLARQRGAKLWELRTSVSLARHWTGVGRHAEAVALLEPLCRWFEQTPETPDLREARTLLSSVSSCPQRIR